jgi:AraC-like DNA-binding protein
LSLFNLMFKRRYGVSPGKWRQKRSAKKSPVSLVRQQSSRLPSLENPRRPLATAVDFN